MHSLIFDFNLSKIIPLVDSGTLQDIEQKKAIIKQYTNEIQCTHCGKKIYSKESFDKAQFELVIAHKDSEIQKLKGELEQLKNESEVMVESFRISTDMLLERLKDLETDNFNGQRPQTAQVLGRIHKKEEGGMKRPQIMSDYKEPDILRLEHEEAEREEMTEENVCPNCRELIPNSEIATHTIQCIRNSSKCKICQESVHKDYKKQHLLDWRRPEKMIAAIEDDDDETILLMFNHGAKAETYLDKKKKQKPLHFVAINGSVRCLLVLMGKGLEELSPIDTDSETPLSLAIKNSQTVIAKSLIQLGAELEVKDSTYRTPLMNACLSGNLEIVEELLEAGADWKATNQINDTCILLAQKSKNHDIVMLLVKTGASLRPVSSTGKLNNNGIESLKIKKKPIIESK